MFNSSAPHLGVTTLSISGEVDIAVAADLVDTAEECLAHPDADTLRIDLAAVTFLDSSGLGALVQARNSARTAGKDLVIANVPASVMKVFTITGLGSALKFEGAS